METGIAAIDWEQAGAEAADLLGQLIQADTSNPPGNERAAADVLARYLGRVELPAQILEPQPQRSNLVCRLAGREPGQQLVLLSHLDVVPAAPQGWERPPFGGERAGGYVWGRGALDIKSLTAIEALCLALIRRHQIPLRRGVTLAATADEERGGTLGAKWLAEHHADLLRAPFVINEGGGHDITAAGHRYYLCQTGEKGVCQLSVTVSGAPGHGAMPRPAHAVGTLVRIVAKLQDDPFPYRLVPATATLLERLANDNGGLFSEALGRLRAGTFDPATLDDLPVSDYFLPELRAMLADTLTPTVLSAGGPVNVVPGQARALFDGRTLPDTDPQTVLDKVARYAASVSREGVEVTPLAVSAGVGFGHRTALFETIQGVMHRHDPEAQVVPYLCPGATDARHLSVLPDITVYGFRPMRQSADAPRHRLVHGVNERISVENLIFGARALFDIVVGCCGTTA